MGNDTTSEPADQGIEQEYDAGLLQRTTGVEADIVKMFMQCANSSISPAETLPPGQIPHTPGADTIITEMAFKYGRADIVIFHIDGSATVIEVKDGARGFTHVVAGIGQASLYAAQLAMSKNALTRVRKALLWTSAGDPTVDAFIVAACKQAGTIAMPWADITKHITIWNTAIDRARAQAAKKESE